MTNPLAVTGGNLTIEDVVGVARGGLALAPLDDAVRKRMDRRRGWLDAVLAEGRHTIYGINTGFGGLAHTPVGIDEEVRRLIEAGHDQAWEILVEYRDVLDNLVLELMEKETLSRQQVVEIFAPVVVREKRPSYSGYGKRLPSDRPPILTPKEQSGNGALPAGAGHTDSVPRDGN